MSNSFIEGKSFDHTSVAASPLEVGEYENCTFSNLDLSSVDFTNFKFIDCVFQGCNFSLAKFGKTVFRDVQFVNCKMLGLNFHQCSEFGLAFTFKGCILNHSSFYRLKIRKTAFNECTMHEVDFTETDLTGSVFGNCDLKDATFDNTLLEKCDLRSAFNYRINPQSNYIRKARFSINGLPGLLADYDIDISD